MVKVTLAKVIFFQKLFGENHVQNKVNHFYSIFGSFSSRLKNPIEKLPK